MTVAPGLCGLCIEVERRSRDLCPGVEVEESAYHSWSVSCRDHGVAHAFLAGCFAGGDLRQEDVDDIAEWSDHVALRRFKVFVSQWTVIAEDVRRYLVEQDAELVIVATDGPADACRAATPRTPPGALGLLAQLGAKLFETGFQRRGSAPGSSKKTKRRPR
jgi:hypothetical protein